MFGKSVPLVAIVLACMLTVGASAVLVNYLSNTVTADFEVTSPMLVGVSLGLEGWEGGSYPEGDHLLSDWTTTGTLTIPDILGGETITIYMMSENLADAEIKGFEEAIVTNTAGVTGADFVSVVVSVDSIYGDLGYGTPQDLIVLGVDIGWFQDGSNSILFGTAGVSTWGEGETDVTKIVVTFNPAASGTYTFSYRIVPET